ncbi:PREDICTED: tyrosine-protein phosphatase non-receptor type 61F isoform X3 [Rhagoletis zephyria]|uniref:tyrosine-protein phosphatase non-receptor type 61F isoform X3 n=2 Tax=Rhagoletis TaxID=28609 RepID=UPI000811A5BC|nr:PREDICTED: tyrosine-protein phosphatase non-receptor type 61F isoform X3 [Rhagoletis zephyria]
MTSTSNKSDTPASNGDSNAATGNSMAAGNDNASCSGSIEAEYNRIANRQGWHRFYQDIRDRCDREASEKQFGTAESEKPQNRCLNRYRDVNPYDHSRIIIHRGSVDYINANLVKLERAERKYILTQGPLVDTVGHFWLMVWEQNTKAILMLNKLMEKKQVKCHHYWPDRKGPENALRLNEVNLTVEFLRCEEYQNFCRRWFKLTDLESKTSREILQFHYTTWPDFGIPSSPVAFLQFLKQVRDSGALDADVGPAVVHCSAGIGRSGTFCLVDCCLVLIEKEGESKVSVQDVLYELRRYRMGLIQTADQLYFSYQAVIEGIKLLKDPEFLNYKEEPINSSDNEHHDQYGTIGGDVPPPLPPRTHSLALPMAGCSAAGALTLNLHGKPLPKIPASASFNDELYAMTDNAQHASKDALNNFINNEKTAENMSNRPLPPLPPQPQRSQSSLERVHESDSDENEFYEDDNSDDDDSDDEGLYNYDNLDDKNANAVNKRSISSERGSGSDGGGGGGNELSTEIKQNGTDGSNSNPLVIGSPENELKRRKRVERQANIEQKVNEIKRKQRETEESKHAAKKRRRMKKY